MSTSRRSAYPSETCWRALPDASPIAQAENDVTPMVTASSGSGDLISRLAFTPGRTAIQPCCPMPLRSSSSAMNNLGSRPCGIRLRDRSRITGKSEAPVNSSSSAWKIAARVARQGCLTTVNGLESAGHTNSRPRAATAAGTNDFTRGPEKITSPRRSESTGFPQVRRHLTTCTASRRSSPAQPRRSPPGAPTATTSFAVRRRKSAFAADPCQRVRSDADACTVEGRPAAVVGERAVKGRAIAALVVQLSRDCGIDSEKDGDDDADGGKRSCGRRGASSGCAHRER